MFLNISKKTCKGRKNVSYGIISSARLSHVIIENNWVNMYYYLDMVSLQIVNGLLISAFIIEIMLV